MIRQAFVILGCLFLAPVARAQAPAPWQLGMPASCHPFSASTDVNDIWRQMYWSVEYVAQPRDALWNWLIHGLTRGTDVQEFAVRALGRLERPELAPLLAQKLSSPVAQIRGEAANALGQALAGSGPAAASLRTEAAALLRKRLDEETDMGVRSVLCETVGRLIYADAAEARSAESLLVHATLGAGGQGDAPFTARLGAVKGLEALLRRHAKLLTPADGTVERLRQLAVCESGARTPAQDTDDARRVRRLALLALAPAQAADGKTLASALTDADWETRRVAVRIAGAGLRAASGPGRQERLDLIRSGLRDTDWHVRYEAVSAAARNQDAPACADLLRAVKDRNPHVALLAIDQLPRCSAESAKETVPVLVRQVRTLPSSGNSASWHKAAHALVALARVSPDRARTEFERFRSHGIWQVRMYAARAAAFLKDAGILRGLASDPDDNVRNAAVSGLAEIERHGADDVYVAQLSRRDSQLLMTAARALRGSADRSALPALSAALGAQTQRDPSRDARLALLERIGELGSADNAAALEPLTNDFDPRVAAAAASILEKWTGTKREAPGQVRRNTSLTLSPEEIERLERATVVVRMKKGGSFTLALLTRQAPVSAAGFARLVECGYYNGLTFHRIEPNFVIQGGSPGANEYAGRQGYMRDEVGLASNVRGSVGLSTRGRDTGDGQWYVNLADNARLDHDYTVFANVVSGMNVVDAILEGDKIADIKIVAGSRK